MHSMERVLTQPSWFFKILVCKDSLSSSPPSTNWQIIITMAFKHMKITVVFILQSSSVIVTLLKMTRCCCHGMRFFSSPRDLCTQRFWSDLIHIVLGFWYIIWSFSEISPITFYLWGFTQSRQFDRNRLKNVPKFAVERILKWNNCV